MVQVYQARYTNFPDFINLTAKLLSLKRRRERDEIKEDEVCLVYSFCLSRFINLTDCFTFKKGAKSRMIAAGIPLWIVDLRNEATHGVIPSVRQLSDASDFMLHFLQNSFWKVPPTAKTFPNEIASLLTQFYESSVHKLSNRNMLLQAITKTVYKQSDEMCNMCRCLADVGYLVPKESLEKGSVLSVLSMNNLPEENVKTWLPVVAIVAKINCIDLLLSSLAENLNPYAPVESTYYCLWIKYILQDIITYESHLTSERQTLQVTAKQISPENLLKILLSKPCAALDIVRVPLLLLCSGTLGPSQQLSLKRLVDSFAAAAKDFQPESYSSLADSYVHKNPMCLDLPGFVNNLDVTTE